MVPLGVLTNNKPLSQVLWIEINENSKKNIPDRLADFYKCSSVNWIPAGSRLPRSSNGFFFFNFSSILNLNILSLFKAFWYLGYAFTSYFHHNYCETQLYVCASSARSKYSNRIVTLTENLARLKVTQ